jgi:hypothetical protein
MERNRADPAWVPAVEPAETVAETLREHRRRGEAPARVRHSGTQPHVHGPPGSALLRSPRSSAPRRRAARGSTLVPGVDLRKDQEPQEGKPLAGKTGAPGSWGRNDLGLGWCFASPSPFLGGPQCDQSSKCHPRVLPAPCPCSLGSQADLSSHGPSRAQRLQPRKSHGATGLASTPLSGGHWTRVCGAPYPDVTPQGPARPGPGYDRAPWVAGAASCPGAGPAHRPGRGHRRQPRGPSRHAPPSRRAKAPTRSHAPISQFPAPTRTNSQSSPPSPGAARLYPTSSPPAPGLTQRPHPHSTLAPYVPNPPEDPPPRRTAPPPRSSPHGHPVTSRTPHSTQSNDPAHSTSPPNTRA